MPAFLIGLAVAVALTAGTALVYDSMPITAVQHSSPSEYVRIDTDASLTAKGTGYGTPEKEKAEAGPRERETATR